jgi:hypothetical protein
MTRLSIEHVLNVAVLVIEDMQHSLSAGDYERYRRDVGRLLVLAEVLVNSPDAAMLEPPPGG